MKLHKYSDVSGHFMLMQIRFPHCFSWQGKVIEIMCSTSAENKLFTK
jgi:hypothetical protein